MLHSTLADAAAIYHFPGARSSRAYSFGSRRTRVARAASSQDIQSRSMVSHHRIADVAPVISQSIHERVTRHHAHIGAAVPAHALQQLEEQLASEAGRHYVLGEFEKALDTYCHTLAVVEKARRPGSLSAMRHNIAACLHQLGDVEAAREYYELALNGFESRAAATPKIEAILFGNADARRADFVRGRLVDINWERKVPRDLAGRPRRRARARARRAAAPRPPARPLTAPPARPPADRAAPAARSPTRRRTSTPTRGRGRRTSARRGGSR